MLALTPIVEELKAGGYRQVEGVLELPAADQPRALPALWVIPTAETANPNLMSGRRDQAVDVGFSVLVTVDGARRHRDGISEQLKVEVDKVIDLLTGWTHPEASRACDYAGGRLLGAAGGPSITWEVRFRSRFHLRKAS